MDCNSFDGIKTQVKLNDNESFIRIRYQIFRETIEKR